VIHQGDLVQILLRWLEERRFSLIVGALIQPLREHCNIAFADGAKDGAAVDACVRSCLPGGRFCELDQGVLVWLINLEDTQTRKPLAWSKSQRVALPLHGPTIDLLPRLKLVGFLPHRLSRPSTVGSELRAGNRRRDPVTNVGVAMNPNYRTLVLILLRFGSPALFSRPLGIFPWPKPTGFLPHRLSRRRGASYRDSATYGVTRLPYPRRLPLVATTGVAPRYSCVAYPAGSLHRPRHAQALAA
jgi:hypothetical protein